MHSASVCAYLLPSEEIVVFPARGSEAGQTNWLMYIPSVPSVSTSHHICPTRLKHGSNSSWVSSSAARSLSSSTATRCGELGRTNDLTRKQRHHLLDGVARDDGHEPGVFRNELAEVFQGRGETICRFDAVEPGFYDHRQPMPMDRRSWAYAFCPAPARPPYSRGRGLPRKVA